MANPVQKAHTALSFVFHDCIVVNRRRNNLRTMATIAIDNLMLTVCDIFHHWMK